MTDQNKTHGVLTDAEIKCVRYAAWDFAAWEAGSLQFRLQFARAIEAAVLAKAAPQAQPAIADDAATIADYEEVLADHRRLVRELDVLLNGDGAAKQASLCDLVSQARRARTDAPKVSAQPAPTPPTSEADAVDSARYRWLRRAGVLCDYSVMSIHWKHSDRLDSEIDARMSRLSGKESGDE